MEQTHDKLASVAKSYNLITLLTGISNPDYEPTPTSGSFNSMINTLFGQTTSGKTSNTGKLYYISDESIVKTITENIYNDLLPITIPRTLTDISIIDYFPEYIVNNYDLAYISGDISNISSNIDLESNSITWHINELKAGETKTVVYTLTLKKEFDNKSYTKY